MRLRSRETVRERWGYVGAPVIDDQHLELAADRRARGKRLNDYLLQRALLVVRGNRDRQSHGNLWSSALATHRRTSPSSLISTVPRGRAGTPNATVYDGMSRFTREWAPITQ